MSDPDAPARPAATSRRRFASTLAAAAGAPLLARALPLAAQAAPAPAATPAATPTPAPPPAALEPTMELVKVKYGRFLSAEQLEGVKKVVERSIRNGERMAKTLLPNSEEPDVVFFAALPGTEGGR